MRWFLVLLILPRLAWAASWEDELSVEARTKVDAALQQYAVQHYDEASELFRAAYLLHPHAKLLYSLAQALRLAGRCSEAAEAYRAFLRTEPAADLAELAEKNSQRCVAVEPAPPVAVVVPELPEPPPAPPARPPWYYDVAGDALMGGGIVAALTSVVFVVDERRTVASLDSRGSYGDYVDGVDRADRSRRVWLVSSAVATGLIAGAMTRYLWSSADP